MSNLVFDPNKLAISCEEKDIGVIGKGMNNLKCVICKSFTCKHVRLVEKLHNFDSDAPFCISELMERKEVSKPKRNPTVVSKLPIDFTIKSSEKHLLRLPPDQQLEKIMMNEQEMLVLEGDFWHQECAGGSEHIVDLDDKSHFKLMKLYTRDGSFSCISKYRCILSQVCLLKNVDESET